jgi:O-antigen ligase
MMAAYDTKMGYFNRGLIALSVFLAIALQIQCDLYATSDYLGLRINIADLLVPVAGAGIFLSLILKQSSWPQFTIAHGWAWIAGLTLVMSLSLVRGEWTQWGFLNKYCGWLVLLSLFLWGAWLNTNASALFVKRFLQIMAYTGIAIMGLGMIVLFLRDSGVLPGKGLFGYPLAGLMANRNAYALFVCALSILLSLFHLKGQDLVPVWLLRVMWISLPLCHVLVGSRAGWICQILIVPGLLIYGVRESFRSILAPLLAGLALVALLSATGLVVVSRGNQLRLLSQMTKVVQDPDLNYEPREIKKKYKLRSDVYRVQAARDAFELWKTSPVLGTGLGSFLVFQEQKYGKIIDLIDNSMLWLLTETGLLGLGAFLGFYILCLYTLARSPDPLSLSIAGILLVFGIFSLFHEILYTRFIWFLLGLGMAAKGAVADKGIEPVRINRQSL